MYEAKIKLDEVHYYFKCCVAMMIPLSLRAFIRKLQRKTTCLDSRRSISMFKIKHKRTGTKLTHNLLLLLPLSEKGVKKMLDVTTH